MAADRDPEPGDIRVRGRTEIDAESFLTGGLDSGGGSEETFSRSVHPCTVGGPPGAMFPLREV